MKEAVLTKEHYLPLDSIIKTYFNPKYVFLPIYENTKLLVNDNKYVYKNDIVMTRENGEQVYSPVSGVVLGVRDMLYATGKYPSIVIENDFKESIKFSPSIKMRISDYTKSEFLKVLKETGLIYNDQFIYRKFNKVTNILVNGVEREPYFGRKYFLLRDYVSDILETVDLISELFHVENAVIAIKNIDNDIISAFMNEMGTYPNIELRLINNDYPNGIDARLKEIVDMKDATVFDVEEIVNIYDCLKKRIVPQDKLITITGDAIDKHCVYNVRKGTILSEVFGGKFNFTEKSVDVYLNGIMTGKLIDTLQYVIDDNFEGIYITKKKERIEKECLNCGLCHKSCPKGLNPKYVRDHEGRVKPQYKETCLHCHLCDFVCPSNRHLSKYMGDL